MSNDRLREIAGKDRPLGIAIEGGELVIRIGIDTLKFAAEHCPRFYSEDVLRGAMGPYVTVTDAEELAKDVRRELFREEEDGSTPFGDLLDKCIEAARDDGSAGFADE